MKNIEKIFVLIISFIVIFYSFFFFLKEKKTFSESENRYLALFPKYNLEALKSGRYMTQIENYLIDHFPYRDFMVSLKTNTYKLVGIKEVNNVYLGKDGYLLEEFKGMNNIDKISKAVNKFQNQLDFKIDFMLVPTSIEINKDKLPKYAINENQIENINNFYSKLQTNYIDLYDTLLSYKDKYQLYYKLLIYKIDGKQNLEIQELLEKEFNQTHSVEYLSSLWRNKIPKMIAEKAKENYLM